MQKVMKRKAVKKKSIRLMHNTRLTLAQQRAMGIIAPPSSLEVLMERALKIQGLHYQAERWIGPYRADFYLPKQNGIHVPYIIEVDGHFSHRTARGKLHDAKKDNYIKSQGIQVMRFTGAQVQQNPIGCVHQLLKTASV